MHRAMPSTAWNTHSNRVMSKKTSSPMHPAMLTKLGTPTQIKWCQRRQVPQCIRAMSIAWTYPLKLKVMSKKTSSPMNWAMLTSLEHPLKLSDVKKDKFPISSGKVHQPWTILLKLELDVKKDMFPTSFGKVVNSLEHLFKLKVMLRKTSSPLSLGKARQAWNTPSNRKWCQRRQIPHFLQQSRPTLEQLHKLRVMLRKTSSPLPLARPP